MDGASLEAALLDYGPAAIDDLLPRLRAIAETLDQAHAGGQVHGSLHPRNIFVADESTHVTGLGDAVEVPVRPPYAAPEIVAGGAARPASDQFALAAITFEWLFGRRISGPAVRPIEVRALPGVNRDALSRAFTRALAPQPADRFASCTAFCQALDAAVIPVLPLGVTEEDDSLESGLLPAPPPSQPIEFDIDAADLAPAPAPIPLTESGRLESFEPQLAAPVQPVAAWQPSAAYAEQKPAEQFTGALLIASCLVCMVVGFAAGYMARPRALQTGPVQTMAPPATGTEAAVPPASAPSASASARPESGELRRDPAEAASGREGGPKAPQALEAAQVPAPVKTGRLLIRSTPSGAAVQMDGVDMGLTPLTLRDLELGSRTIVVTRRGHVSEERRVVLSAARPSQSLDLRLSAMAAPRSQPAPTTAARPAGEATGVLMVESRPPGAAVAINGRPSGTTPATIAALAPGDYRVSLSLSGYRTFVTTVRVVAGERTRAAASLSAQE